MSDLSEETSQNTQRHQTKPDDVVPISTKILFGTCQIADTFIGNAAHQLVNPIYNIALGINPAFIGIVLAVGRLLDAFFDPLIGNFSDNFRSRFGRRRPLIIAGAFASGFAFWAMFFIPRGWSVSGYSCLLACTALLYFPAYALLSIPRAAMSIELTPDYHERTRVSAVSALLNPLGGVMAVWLFALTKLDIFEDSLHGARYVGFAAFVIVLVLGSLPGWLVREKGYHETRHQAKLSFRRSVAMVWGNKPLLLLGSSGLCIMVGLFTVFSLGLYLTIYHVFGGNVKTASFWYGAASTSYQIASIAAVAPVSRIARRFDKRRTLVGCLLVAFVGTISKWFCFTPAAPWLMFIPMVLLGSGMAGFWVLSIAMMADVCDHDELQNGFRREAMLSAVNVWIYKSGMSLAYLLSGFVLVWTGFREELGGAQDAGSIFWMRLLYSFVPGLALLIAMACILRYPITEEAAYNTRRTIERRRREAEGTV